MLNFEKGKVYAKAHKVKVYAIAHKVAKIQGLEKSIFGHCTTHLILFQYNKVSLGTFLRHLNKKASKTRYNNNKNKLNNVRPAVW